MTQPLVSIIILNYNAGQILLDCFESVIKTNYDNFEIIIVDNASEDKSYRKCKEKFERTRIIENEKNLGYCEGNNIGIREAKGDYIVILNPDTIVESNCIEELISAYSKFGEGLYQPKILSLNEKQVLQSTGNMLHIFGFGQCLDHVCYDLREGRMTRDEAVDLVKKYDGKCSEAYIEKFCIYIGISQKEFWATTEKFRGSMWRKGSDDGWINSMHEML